MATKLIELVEDDSKFRALGEPKIIDYHRDNNEERGRAVTDLASSLILGGGVLAYKLGEKRLVSGETSHSWLQAVQFYRAI